MKPVASWPQLTPCSQAAGPGDRALRSGLPEAFPAGFLGGAALRTWLRAQQGISVSGAVALEG